MKVIYKYTVEAIREFEVIMPDEAKILTVQVQNDLPQIWALVDPENKPFSYQFRVVGTGHELPDDFIGRYIGTFQLALGSLVFHLFLINHLKTHEVTP